MTELWGIFYLLWTVLCYFLAKRLFVFTQKIYFSPIIVVPSLSIILISIFQHRFQDYYQYTQYLVAMLGPITVAFAIPVFRYRAIVKQYFFVLIVSSSVSMLVGILSSWLLASIFNFDEILKNSLLARSISIPFALELTEKIGGSINLIPLFTVITGLVGMLFGDFLLLWMRYKNRIAQGAALGNAAHAMGIARARQRHELEGVIASLSMIISGIIMVLFAPFMKYQQTLILGVKTMAGLSIWHVLIFAIVVILLFGTSKLKNLGKDVGGAVKDFKKSIQDDETTTAALNEPRTQEHQNSNADVNSTVKH